MVLIEPLLNSMIPPEPLLNDQRIIDEYFCLSKYENMQNMAWLLGMVAVYGKRPEELKDFKWNKDLTITLKNKKRSLSPCHPHWAFLFGLKEKQPSDMETHWETFLKKAIKKWEEGQIRIDIPALLKAYKIRKDFYKKSKNL